MKNNADAKLINNTEVSRIFNIKRSNLARAKKMSEGKILEPFNDMGPIKETSMGKNVS